MELSKRLTAVAGMVTKGNIVCDVGCDHGYVSIYLVRERISPRVIAMDVRKGPLAQAKEHIRLYGLEDYIETRLSDGVDALKVGEADTLILAGMGGRLMEGILTRGREKVIRMKELILQPQSEIAAFRKFLREAGFKIASEDMVFEEGKFYPMMRVIPQMQGADVDADAQKDVVQSECVQSECVQIGESEKLPGEEAESLEDLYGGLLLRQRHPVLKQYLNYRKEKLTQLLQDLTAASGGSEKSRMRVEEVKQELFRNELAREWYKNK